MPKLLFRFIFEFQITYLNLILEKVVWLNMTPYCECSASESFGRKSTEGYFIYLQFILFIKQIFHLFFFFATVFYLSNFPFSKFVCIFNPVHLFDASFTWQYYAGLSVSMLGKIIFLFQTHFGSKTFLFPLFFLLYATYCKCCFMLDHFAFKLQPLEHEHTLSWMIYFTFCIHNFHVDFTVCFSSCVNFLIFLLFSMEKHF